MIGSAGVTSGLVSGEESIFEFGDDDSALAGDLPSPHEMRSGLRREAHSHWIRQLSDVQSRQCLPVE